MKTAAANEVRVTRRIHATAERVFQAFTTPSDLERWYAPQGMTVPNAKFELWVGGAFRIEMKAPDGTIHTAHGVYREISPPSRLSHTWSWEKPMEGEAGETLVTIELRPDGDHTEVHWFTAVSRPLPVRPIMRRAGPAFWIAWSSSFKATRNTEGRDRI